MLLTKLHIPQPKENIVHRSALFEKLNEGLNRNLILVSATAGYGKTTLVSDWINQNKIPAAWYSVDSRDNDPYEFLNFIISGIKTIHKNVGNESLELLKSLGTVEIGYIIELFINDMLSVKEDFLLVVDDLHLLSSKEIFKALSFILDYKPQNFKIALLTRSDPPLSLARLRSQNELLEIRSSDLSFTERDTTEFLNRKLKLGLTPSDINLVELKTEGWIAGLQLTALTLRNKENISEYIRKIAGDNRYIMDYLIEEVLNNLDNETRDFLLKTSILEKLSGTLCDSVTKINNSQFILETLEKNNMFIVPLDNERQWFRYHHLFGDLLNQRLLIKHKELVSELHNRASFWFEKNDMPLMAAEHALKAGNKQKGLELIDEIIDYLIETSQYTLVIKYADLFPEKDVFSNLKFGIMHAWTLTIVGRLTEAEEFLNKLNGIIHGEDVRNLKKGLLGRLYITNTLLKDYMGDVESASHYADLSVKNMNENNNVWNSWTFYSKALSQLIRFELDESISSFSKGLDFAKKANNTYLEIVHTIHFAYFMRFKGRYQESLKICNGLLEKYKAKTHTEGFKFNLYSSILYSTIGLMIAEQGNTNSGIELALKGYELSQNLISISFKGYGLLLLAETYYKTGELETALEILEKQDTRLLKNTRHWLTVLSYTLKLKLFSLLGHKEDAESLYKKLIKPANSNHYEYCLYSIASAHYFISSAKYDEADAILEELSSELKDKKVLELFTEVELMKAKIYLWKGKETDAINCIVNLLRNTQDEGFVRIYINEGNEMESLIKEIKQQKKIKSSEQLDAVSPEYLNSLIKAFKKENNTKRSASEDVLSTRELDTLKLLAKNYSNQQIADELFISLNTVKTHLKNINLKLEVDNRRKAVVKAKELGFI